VNLKKTVLIFFHNAKKKDIAFSGIVLLLILALYWMPTGFEERLQENTEKVEGRILTVDNSHLEQHGLVLSGTQSVEIELLKGRFKGQTFRTANNFLGKMDIDRLFQPGEHALINVSFRDGVITAVYTADHYRLRVEFVLLCVFSLFLLAYGGFFGFQAMLSFFFTALVIWKIMIPLSLKGFDPVLLSFVLVCILSAAILFLVAGLNKKALIALIGSTVGLGITTLMSLYSTSLFKLNGAVGNFSETLVYSGFTHINLTSIFIAGVVLSASGAVMDLAIDISAAMNEIVRHNPEISRRELFFSGNNIGRSVIGTQMTTLILAYSGGYLCMLMLFMGLGVPNANIINMNYVAAEVLHTIVGSFGLVLVAPITTIVGSILYIPIKKPSSR
jgi:uncharacterized membrane protein